MFSILKWFGHTIHESIKTAFIDNDDEISIRNRLLVRDDEVRSDVRLEVKGTTEAGATGQEFLVIARFDDDDADKVVAMLKGIHPYNQDFAEIFGGEDALGAFGKGFILKHEKANKRYAVYRSESGVWDGSETLCFYTDEDGNLHVRGNVTADGTIQLESHALGGAGHDADTLENLNNKISDANLDDAGDERDPTDHDILAKHTTTETGANKYLKADGTGGLEFGTPAGGNGKGIFRILPVSLLSSGDGGDTDVIAEATSRTYRSHVGAATGQTRNYFQAEILPPDFHSMDRIIVETYRTGTTTSFTLTLSNKGTDDNDLTDENIRPASSIAWQTFTFTDFDLNYSAGDQIMLKFVSTVSTGQGQFISRIHIIYNRS